MRVEGVINGSLRQGSPLREPPSNENAAAIVLCICVTGSAAPASAYRPFDGTDAAVANVGEVEIEFQPVGALRAGSTSLVSEAIFNYSFAERWEFVLQGTGDTTRGSGSNQCP